MNWQNDTPCEATKAGQRNLDSAALLDYLGTLCSELAMGEKVEPNKLFELTRCGHYPKHITSLAESFGMMLVKVEAREFKLEALNEELRQANLLLEQARGKLARENTQLKKTLNREFSLRNVVGKSPAMQKVLQQLNRVADTPASILFTGETGTGKTMLAKAVHYQSDRAHGPFISLNCSAMPETLVESELFGVEKGTATGVERREGRFELAEGGTLFLDEIGDMPLSAQAKMLKVIEDREVTRVGGRKAVPVNIRIIAASNKNLRREAEQGSFRQDLFFRLNIINLEVPPLCSRQEDIPLLLKTFVDKHAATYGRKGLKPAPGLMESLCRYPWPGNVRELDNEVERAVILGTGTQLELDDFSDALRNAVAMKLPPQPAGRSNGTLEDAERTMIMQVLTETNNNKSQAAKRLGISREGLRKKLIRFGMV